MRKRKAPVPIDPADAARGEAAERDFQRWLDASCLPHIYVEQSPMTVPGSLRGRIKRPDYLVAIPHVGMVAFDVKCKSLYEGRFLFDVDEVQRLRTFSRLFRLTVFFACLDPEGSDQSYWVRLDKLDSAAAFKRNGKLVLSLALGDAHPVSMQTDFFKAFSAAISES